MVNLLYIYSNSIGALHKDYNEYDIECCFFLHPQDILPYPVQNFFEDHGGIKSLSQFAETFINDSNSNDRAQAVFLQKVKQKLSQDGSYLSFCKMLLDLHGKKNPLIIDLSDCPPDVSPFLHYMLLNSGNSHVKAVVWNQLDPIPNEIPLFILEPAAKTFVRLISLGYQTIPALQRAYISHKVKKSKKLDQKEMISQPTVSKYLSKLKKRGIIESYFEGKKKIFSISPNFRHLL